MKMKASAITAAALLALAAQSASATEAVGYNTLTVPTNSDVLVSVPFNQNAVGSFTVSSVTANGVTVADTLTANAYTNGYYVRFTTGGGAGLWSTISTNGTGGFTLADTNALTGVTAGNTFKVYPHQTLAKVFPDGLIDIAMEASIKHPTLPSIQTYKTQVLVYDGAATAWNKTPPLKYYFYNGAWRKVGSALTASFDNSVLRPGAYFAIRNQNSSNELTYISNGDVPQDTLAMTLVSGTADDVLTTTGRPIPVTLAELGLGGTSAFVNSVKHPALPSIQTYGDRLLVFNNTGSIVNRTPSATYYYYNGAWRKVGQALTASFNTAVINPSEGFIIRKGNALGSGVHVWANSASY